MNATAKKIYEGLPNGNTIIMQKELAAKCCIAHFTLRKYLKILVAKGLIKKEVIPYLGGDKNSGTRITMITKFANKTLD